jgi:hypothetical protein
MYDLKVVSLVGCYQVLWHCTEVQWTIGKANEVLMAISAL